MNYEPFRSKDYIDIGLAWHEAMAEWYLPERWTEPIGIRARRALETFSSARAQQMRTYIQAGVDDPELDKKFDEDTELGNGMLQNYFRWSIENDGFLIPVFVEKEFEVPILIPTGEFVPAHSEVSINFCAPGGFASNNGRLVKWHEDLKKFLPVVYQGRVDGLVKDAYGNHFILEHKTTGQLGGTQWLAMDEQVGSYIWALREMLHIDIKGIIHTSAIKRAPDSPKILKNGTLSTDKRQATTLGHYQRAIATLHPALRPEDYLDSQYGEMLRFLASDAAPVFVRRITTDCPHEMIDDIGERIYYEAVEMLSNPAIYPTVSPMNCNPCPFYGPCLSRQEHSDWEFMLRSSFKKRAPNV